MAEFIDTDARERGIGVVRLLPSDEAPTKRHPKLVALLVGEDYEVGAGRPDWGHLGALPGVWQDLARVKHIFVVDICARLRVDTFEKRSWIMLA